MRKVVRLTESDIERLVQKIILEEQKFSNRKKITENVRQLITNQELEGEELDEGWLENILAGLMLLGGVAKGQEVKEKGFTALRNDEVRKEIQSVVDNPNKLDAVTKNLSPEDIQKIKQNAEQNLEKLNANKKRTFSQKTTANSTETVKRLLKAGWVPVNVSFKEDTVYTYKDTVIMENNNLNFSLPGDDSFVTGDFKLSENAMSSIKSLVDSIKNNGGQIHSIVIESSTDWEPINKPGIKNNMELAQKRAESVKKAFKDNGVNVNIISTEKDSTGFGGPKPEQGPNVYSTSMSKEERISARSQTAKFRAVDIRANVTFPEISKKQVEPEEISGSNKEFKVELSRVSIGKKFKKPP